MSEPTSPATGMTPGLPESVANSWRAHLASPLAVMILVPALVVIVGVIIAIMGYQQTLQSAKTMAEERLADGWQQVADIANARFSSADQILATVEAAALRHVGSEDPLAWYPELAPLFVDRHALAYVGFSNTAGLFTGVYTDDRHGLVFTVRDASRYGGWKRDYVVDGGISTMVGELRDTGYDPRTRDFWKLAIAGPDATWSQPYRLYTDGEVGVTRTRAVRGRDGGLIGVVFAIWTTLRLSEELEKKAPGFIDRLQLTTTDGIVLAATGATKRRGTTSRQSPVERVVDLGDPIQLAISQAKVPPAGGIVDLTDPADPGRYLVYRKRLEVGNGWILSLGSHLDPLLATARQQVVTTAMVVAFILPLAVLIAFAYARHVVRVTSAARAARHDARLAQEQANTLSSYVLHRRLGAGGMGEVWEARHRLLARPAALKLIKAGSSDPHISARFRREARVTASLTSLHTITIYDFGALADGTLYYAMELLNGADLAELLQEHGPLPQEAVVEVMLQVCDSLAEAHAVGLIHRDIKPANLFLARIGRRSELIKVLDFGLAMARNIDESRHDRLTGIGLINGTPGFMAPEQISGHEIDGRADLYALGCTAFQLLTGRKAFRAANPLEELHCHIHEPIPRISVLGEAQLTPALDDLLVDLLAKQPSDRPASADALRDRLLAAGIVPSLESISTWIGTQVELEKPRASSESHLRVQVQLGSEAGNRTQ